MGRVLLFLLFTSICFKPFTQSPTTSNIEKVRTYWEEVWNKGNLQAIADFYHSNAKHGESFTIEGFQKGIIAFRTAFPDFRGSSTTYLLPTIR